MLSALTVVLGLFLPPAQEPQIRGLELRADLAFLTSDSVEGRACGSAGDAAVISYLVERMHGLGLEPLDGSFEQPFAVSDARPRGFDADSTRFAVRYGAKRCSLRMGVDALPFAGSANGRAAGKVVFVGYGLKVPELGRDDYEALDVRGKVVLALRGAPRWTDADSPYRKYPRTLSFAAKMANATAAGAVGFLLCERQAPDNPEAEARELALALRSRGATDVPAFWISRRAAASWFNGRKGALDYVQGRIDDEDERIRCRLSVAVDLEVELDPPHPDLRTANVVGVLRGSDAELADEFVVLGAHHDHLGRGDIGSLGGAAAVGQIHPGADDNASGVAGLLRVARLMAGSEPRRTVIFAAFGAGAVGSRGSRWFLEKSGIPREQLVAMLNLDMIGRAGSGLSIEGLAAGKGWRGIVEDAVDGSSLAVSLRDVSRHASDHGRFLAVGVPALLFHTGLHAQFHCPSDTASLVQIEAASRVADMVAEIAQGLAQAVNRPEFCSASGSRSGR